MLIQSLHFIYYAVLFLCLIFALRYRNNTGMAIYLAYVILTEFLGVYAKSAVSDFNASGSYNIYFLLSIPYFVFLFHRYTRHFKVIILAAGSSAFLAGSFFLLSEPFDKVCIQLALCFILFNFIAAPLWFVSQLRSPTEIPITQKFMCWISIALLLWSCYYIFRLLPMYYLNRVDQAFLQLLYLGNNLINIMTYLLYLRGILCLKHKDYLQA